MADDEHETSPARGGGKRLAGLPIGVWAVIIGVGAAAIWWWRGQQSAAAAPAATTTDTSTLPTTITPVNEGLSEQQYEGLLGAIKGLQGPPSQPMTPSTGGGTLITEPISTAPPPATSTTTARPSSSSGGGSNWITVPEGSGWSFGSIASQYGHSAQDLWAYQLAPGVRPASTQAALRARGIDHALFGGSSVAVPTSWKRK